MMVLDSHKCCIVLGTVKVLLHWTTYNEIILICGQTELTPYNPCGCHTDIRKFKQMNGTLYQHIPVYRPPTNRPLTDRPPIDRLSTAYRPPTTYRPPTDHLLTTFRTLTDHLLTTPTDHLPTTFYGAACSRLRTKHATCLAILLWCKLHQNLSSVTYQDSNLSHNFCCCKCCRK